ncbi:MAG TPA: hypothetical protein HA254_02745 [Candidatus Diapherotrites archaeon]|uniref:Aminomethyltransferase folate-binding domain-containing protein n=1 Tax=Candidatus Iainarchaeum sp. TaxID=3101447 RepID=A0A7J4J0H1_9ARCH|nr:hypothetical protein [Candidatus Diapherotrites archaeon]
MESYAKMPYSVLRISGNAEKTLNGITSNTLDAPRNAFLDIYGKIVATFYQQRLNGEIFIALPAKSLSASLAHLKPYAAIGKAMVETTQLQAYYLPEEDTMEMPGFKIPERQGCVLIAPNLPMALNQMDDDEFTLLRLERGISMQGIEFENEMIMNTDWKDAVSFSKGCYLGQEIVSKISMRGKPPKKLVRVAFEKEPQNLNIENSQLLTKAYSKSLGKWIAYCSLPSQIKEVKGGQIID